MVFKKKNPVCRDILLSLKVVFAFNGVHITEPGGGLLPIAIQVSSLDCSRPPDSQ